MSPVPKIQGPSTEKRIIVNMIGVRVSLQPSSHRFRSQANDTPVLTTARAGQAGPKLQRCKSDVHRQCIPPAANMQPGQQHHILLCYCPPAPACQVDSLQLLAAVQDGSVARQYGRHGHIEALQMLFHQQLHLQFAARGGATLAIALVHGTVAVLEQVTMTPTAMSSYCTSLLVVAAGHTRAWRRLDRVLQHTVSPRHTAAEPGFACLHIECWQPLGLLLLQI